jgi:hypothetical protein
MIDAPAIRCNIKPNSAEECRNVGDGSISKKTLRIYPLGQIRYVVVRFYANHEVFFAYSKISSSREILLGHPINIPPTAFKIEFFLLVNDDSLHFFFFA